MGSAPRQGDLVARSLKGRVGKPTATTTTLKALPAYSDSRVDGAITVVLFDSSVWIFDAESSAGASATVLVPDAGPGRFLALAAAAGGTSADLVTVADAGGFTAQTQAEAALQEIYQHLLSANAASVPLPVDLWREVDSGGDYANIAGNGGILAADTTPILRSDANNSAEISWATGNADPIQRTFVVPANADDTKDATLELWVYSGTTNAATMSIGTSWDGGTVVTDSADDSATKSATIHKITATIDKADIPTGARRCTISLTPPTHATNAIQLVNAQLVFAPKLLVA